MAVVAFVAVQVVATCHATDLGVVAAAAAAAGGQRKMHYSQGY